MHSPRLSRRQILTGLAAAASVVACGSPRTAPVPAPAPAPAPEPGFADLERRFSARLGVSAVDVATERTVRYQDDLRIAMCSTFKVYACAAVLHRVETDGLRLLDEIEVAAADVVVNSPVTSLRAGSAMSVADLCSAALTQSDNTAGNLLLRLVGGPAAITEYARSVGDDSTRLDRWEPELNSAEPGDPRDTTTAAGLAAGYRSVLAGYALRGSGRDGLESWMRSTATSDKRIRAGLPPGWTSADKTGAGSYATTNDAGLLIGPDGRRIVVAILTDNHPGGPRDAEPLNELVAAATTAVLEVLTAP